MYKFISFFLFLILAISPVVSASAAEKLIMNEQTGVVEDNTGEKLKSVKELFKSKKDSVPKVPDIISNKPDMIDVDTGETEPAAPMQQPVTNPVTNPATNPVPAPIVQPQINQNAQPIESQKVDEAANSNVIKIQSDADFLAENKGKSLLFDAQKLDSMMRVFTAYQESQLGKEDDSLEKDENKKSLEELQQELLAKLQPENFVKSNAEIITIRLPAYVKLDSIIYRSADNKKAWINSKKYNESEGNDELTMRIIQKDFIIMALSLKDTNINPEDLNKRIIKSGSANAISIDESKPALIFRLSLNQHLDLTKMKIIEGDFDASSYDLLSKTSQYYDPTKPEDRFVPLEEAKKAAEEARTLADQEVINPADNEAIDAPLPKSSEPQIIQRNRLGIKQ